MTKNREFVIVISSRLLAIFVSLLSMKVISTVLEVDEVGVYYLVNTFFTLLCFSFFNPFGSYFNRMTYKDKIEGNIKKSVKSMLFFRVFMTLAMIPFIVLFFYYFENDFSFNAVEFSLIILLLIFSSLVLVYLESINILGGRVFYSISNSLMLMFGLFLSSSLLFFFDATAIYWFVGVAFSQLLFLFFIYRKLLKYNPTLRCGNTQSFSWKNRRSIIGFSAPISLVILTQWFQSSSYRLYFAEVYTLDVVASISVGMAVASASFVAIESICYQYLSPQYFRCIDSSSSRFRSNVWNDYAKLVLPIYVITFVFIFSCSKELLLILTDNKFVSAIPFVMMGAVIELFRVSSNLLLLVCQSEMDTKFAVKPYVSGSVLLILIYLLWIPNSEPNVAFFGILFSYILTFFLLLGSSKKSLDILIPTRLMLQAGLISSVFLSSFIFPVNSFISSLGKISIYGLLYIIVVYFLVRVSSRGNIIYESSH